MIDAVHDVELVAEGEGLGLLREHHRAVDLAIRPNGDDDDLCIAQPLHVAGPAADEGRSGWLGVRGGNDGKHAQDQKSSRCRVSHCPAAVEKSLEDYRAPRRGASTKSVRPCK